MAVKQISAEKLLLPVGSLPHPSITVNEAGMIEAVSTVDGLPSQDGTVLTSAFLDVHTHGAVGHDVMRATAAELSRMQRFLATRGVGWYLPSTVTASLDATLRAVENLADAIERGPQPGEAQPIGLHLEGPFLCPLKRGMHPTAHLQTPSIELFDRLQEAARGHVLLMTVAPELPGALDLIRHATAGGVKISLGHSNATAEETRLGIEAGAVSATHTFNAMRPLDHREPGILGTTLDDERLYAEMICDEVHVSAPMIRLWWKAKSENRVLLVTDALEATGGADGSYSLGGTAVTVRDGRAFVTEDLAAGKETLAGSLLTMDVAIANLKRLTQASLDRLVRAASHNPAAMLGRPELTSLAPGSMANFNRFDPSGRLVQTYLRGESVPPFAP
jgi:N-acetylglucosamine-6-phosphate deacetylase